MVTRVQLPIMYRVASSSEDSIALAIWTFIQCGLEFFATFFTFPSGRRSGTTLNNCIVDSTGNCKNGIPWRTGKNGIPESVRGGRIRAQGACCAQDRTG